ncbi:MAG: bifunctional proline dehydrogenase/L-glutamate gamma-semialdehyde dehydrogenase PutA [Rhodospirillales bacterium]|nr:bifunctional proline dehydrogenase/L-glutamate gamma-semialdehyde dehydrogenase PutA [Rhodospirillales bacterium]
MHDETRIAIHRAALTEETALVRSLVEQTGFDPEARRTVSEAAAGLVRSVRAVGKTGIVERFLSEYGLSTKEGVALMCLAEAMLRVPDSSTLDELIEDKIAPHDWSAHLGEANSILVNASTWGLMLTGRLLKDGDPGMVRTLRGMLRRLGEPVVRVAVGQAMAEMGAQFVLGRTIEEAMKRGAAQVRRGYGYSYDMLGEAARTEADALDYHRAYAKAIAAIAGNTLSPDIRDNPGISVKLSALHPRYEATQRETMLPVLVGRTLTLAQSAKAARIGFNIDAEEADRLELSLDVIEGLLSDPSLAGWDGFGVVVQAYSRRAMAVLDWLYALARRLDRKITVRLVKGAYWDMEIKRAQVMGLKSFPVFTRKAHSDISYLAAARKLLGMTDRIYPQFATHNAHSAAAVLEMAKGDVDRFEFQRLHGMGEALHRAVKEKAGTRCRIYAPVGAHSDLLAYLVRRLLENGANGSFVNRIVDLDIPPERISRDPVETAAETGFVPNPAIVVPQRLFGTRCNSKGRDLTDPLDLAAIEAGRVPFAAPWRWQAVPLTPLAVSAKHAVEIRNPARPDEAVGTLVEADAALAAAAVTVALEAQPGWEATGAEARAAILRRVADLYEANSFEFLALATREAGKTLLDGVAEIREAVDFLRYYADEAEELGGRPARGAIVCISPWNFPLAIFTGQIAAALAAGNAVIAKPAEQTPLIAYRAVQMMREAGVPEGAIQFLPGDGAKVGGPLTADPRIAGVCFTGSTEVAKIIDRQLAQTAPDAMLIAETGGINAMIVDSTALLEQAVRDIVRAAFQSAGQRCSALRILYVQQEVAGGLLKMLQGAMDVLNLGDPWQLATDVGPVIDAEARDRIDGYIAAQEAQGRVLKRLERPQQGFFIAPTVLRSDGIAEMEREVFGPILHVATFEAGEIDAVIDAVNAKGYGLTFGLHTRIDRRVQRVLDRIEVGNVYVNRDQIGAVVGSQPFGGQGLSGTGPKAGGAHYLPRFLRAAHSESSVAAAESASAEAIAAALAELNAGAWRVSPGRIPLLRKLLRGRAAEAIAAAAGLESTTDLPGPTGESNRFALGPRGKVLCLGRDGETLLAQVVQALAAGNAVIAVAPLARRVLAPLLDAPVLPLAALDGTCPAEALATLPVSVVACGGSAELRAPLRRALAERDGPIVPLIAETLAPVAYCSECTICIDTTAAGGNASLLAEASL